MKKLFITVATVLMFAGPALAEQSTVDMDAVFAKRQHFYEMSLKMVDAQMHTLKEQEARLTGWQRLLKQMMENELNSHGNR